MPSIISSVLAGLSACVQWCFGRFKANNAPDVKRAAVAADDEKVLVKTDADIAKGDPAELGKDIS